MGRVVSFKKFNKWAEFELLGAFCISNLLLFSKIRLECLSQIFEAGGILTPEIKWQAFRCKDDRNPGLFGRRSCFDYKKIWYQKCWHKYNLHRDHSSITSAKRWVGGVRKWQFLLIYITIYSDVGGPKKAKNMLT